MSESKRRFEEEFLATVLKQPEVQLTALRAVDGYGFSTPWLQEAYDIMRRRAESNVPLEGPELLSEERKYLTAPIIANLLTKGLVGANIEYFVNRLKNNQMREKARERLVSISQHLSREDADMGRLREQADEMRSFLVDTSCSDIWLNNKVLISQTIKRIEDEVTGEIELGKKTGYEKFDALTGGLNAGDLWVIAARPSMGKTAFALNIMNRMMKKDLKTVFFSLEMTNTDVMKRLLSLNAKIDGHKFLNTDFNSFEMDRIHAFSKKFHEKENFFMCDKMLDIVSIKKEIDDLHKKIGKIDVVCVDYIQHVKTPDDKYKNRERSIAEVSLGLKEIAKTYEATVLAVSQLSRQVDSRKPPRPFMSDLRDSGSIEQDADVVCLLYRDEYYNPQSNLPGVCEVDIAKNRKGRVGKVDFNFNGSYMRFEEP